MTEHDDRYDAYLSEFRSRLIAAKPSRGTSRRRTRAASATATLRRPLVAGGVACLAAVAATAGVVGLPGGGTLDPVARASAALAPDGQIIHMRLTATPVATEPDMTVPGPQTSDYWAASDPTRWRLAVMTPDGAHTFDDLGPIEGRQEYAYADGATSSYVAGRDTLRITTGHPNDEGSRVPSAIPLDPERDIRPLLERGELEDTGELVVDGRRVRRLKGTQAPLDNGHGMIVTRSVTYDVDAASFEPVGGRLEIKITRKHRRADDAKTVRGMPEVRMDFRVDLYERLPDDDAHAHLLEPQTTPDTKVTTETVEELRERIKRRRVAEREAADERREALRRAADDG